MKEGVRESKMLGLVPTRYSSDEEGVLFEDIPDLASRDSLWVPESST
jgi:hypothetical protein